jgi:hypothetical protein
MLLEARGNKKDLGMSLTIVVKAFAVAQYCFSSTQQYPSLAFEMQSYFWKSLARHMQLSCTQELCSCIHTLIFSDHSQHSIDMK